MTESKRKFFSGRTVDQAVVAAANHYGIHPGEVKYREIEKRHGFVRTRRNAVIAVDPEDFKKPAGGRVAGPERRPTEEREREPAPREPREARERTEPPRAEPAPAAAAEEERGEQFLPRERRPRRRESGRDRGRPGRRERAGGRDETAGEQEERPRPKRRGAPGPWWQAEPVTDETEEMEERAAPEDEGAPPEEEDEGERYRFVERSEGLKRRERPGSPVTETPRRRPPRERRRAGRGRSPEDRQERRGRGRRGREGGPVRREAPAAPPAPPLARPAPRADRLPRADEELSEAAQDALDRLLEFAGVEAEADFFQNEERLEIELWGPDDYLLLEDDGQLLLAIEHLLPRMLRSLYGDSMPVRVDCDEFHARREERLRVVALETAEEVRRRGKPRTLDELDPAERRIVHLSLADVEDVRTESLGDGYFKRVKVFPA